jgi:hypothetical protein
MAWNLMVYGCECSELLHCDLSMVLIWCINRSSFSSKCLMVSFRLSISSLVRLLPSSSTNINWEAAGDFDGE